MATMRQPRSSVAFWPLVVRCWQLLSSVRGLSVSYDFVGGHDDFVRCCDQSFLVYDIYRDSKGKRGFVSQPVGTHVSPLLIPVLNDVPTIVAVVDQVELAARHIAGEIGPGSLRVHGH